MRIRKYKLVLPCKKEHQAFGNIIINKNTSKVGLILKFHEKRFFDQVEYIYFDNFGSKIYSMTMRSLIRDFYVLEFKD